MESRPDVVGAIAIDQDGFFTETVAFTSDEAAREAESMSLLDNVEPGVAQALVRLTPPTADSDDHVRARDDKLDFFDLPHTNTQTPATGI
jgi:hypothetical protein